MELSKFKDELRGKIMDFSACAHLIDLHKASKNKKEKDILEKYLKLENWIIVNSPLDKIIKENSMEEETEIEEEEDDEVEIEEEDDDQDSLGF